MNPPSPTSPSPLVPQGSIPPKNTSRSGRVLLIALTVVAFHLAGLGVVLMQGCQKDAKTGGLGSETNNTALSLPPETNSFFTSASNLPPATPRPMSNNAMMASSPGLSTPTPAPANMGMIPNPNPATGTPGLSEPPVSAPAAAAPAETGATTDYKVASGDTLGKIAAKNHITLSALTKANPNLDPRKLQPGKTIKIPVSAASTVPAPATSLTAGSVPTATPAAAPVASASGTYKVKSGDTLTKIAKANGISVSELRAANKLKTSQLLAGQTLRIPARTTAAAPGTTNH